MKVFEVRSLLPFFLLRIHYSAPLNSNEEHTPDAAGTAVTGRYTLLYPPGFVMSMWDENMPGIAGTFSVLDLGDQRNDYGHPARLFSEKALQRIHDTGLYEGMIQAFLPDQVHG